MGNNKLQVSESLPRAFTSEENEKYFLMAKEGDLSALDKIKEHNLRLVIRIINDNFFQVEGFDEDELFSIGLYGLNKAVDTFNIDNGKKFSTYAGRVIKNEILMAIRKTKHSRTEISLDSIVSEGKNGRELSLMDTIASDINLEEESINNELKSHVIKFLGNLSKLERNVVELRYGFNGEVLTFAQIAEVIGLSKTYVFMINTKALNKLRRYILDEGLIEQKNNMIKDENISELSAEEKASFYAKLIVEDGLSVDDLEAKFGMKASSIKGLISKKLPSLDNDLYIRVQNILTSEKSNKPNSSETNPKRSKKDVKANINHPKARVDETIFSLFSGYTEEQIRKTLENLKETERELFLLRYPLNGETPKSLNFISKTYNIKKGSVRAKLNSIKNKIMKRLEGQVPTDEKTIFEYFPSYSTREVLMAISILNYESRRIIELKYGLNGNNVTSNNEIAELYNTKPQTISGRIYAVRASIQRKLEDLRKHNAIQEFEVSSFNQTQFIGNTIELIQDEDVTLITDKSQTIIDSNFEQCREQVKKLINLLNDPTEQVILLLRLGYVREKYYSEIEIAQFLNMREEEVKNILNKTLSSLVCISPNTLNWLESNKVITLNTL